MNSFIEWMRKIWILSGMYCRKDTQSRFDFYSRYVWILFACLTYRYLFQMTFRVKRIPFGAYEIDFALFLISGFATIRFIVFAIRVFEDAIRELRKTHVLEWALVTPTSLWEFVLSSALWKGFVAATEFALAIGFAKFFIGTPFWPFFQPPVLGAISLAILAYAGIGMIVSAFVLLLQRGNFLFAMLEQISFLAAGAFFPSRLLSKGISAVVFCFPVTPALQIVGYTLIGVDAGEQGPLFFHLGFLALLFSTLGATLLQVSLVLSRRHGWLLTPSPLQ